MTWSAADWRAILPLLLLALTPVVAMVEIGVRRSHLRTMAITVAGLAATLATLPVAARAAPRAVTELLTMDGTALWFIGLIAGAALIVALLAYPYLKRREGPAEEFYLLLATGTLGAAVLAASSHFASFFLGLEVLSVSLYGLSAYPREAPAALEAGIKYLVLAASSAAFLLFGMALIYMATGTMSVAGLAATLARTGSPLVLPGAALVLVGVGFKLGLVPFHLWTPDVYQGAPAPVGAFIATASKAGVFAVLLRFYVAWGAAPGGQVRLLITVVAIASMAAGNLLALRQRNLKRLLGYSSIAHMGYLLVAVEAAAGAPGVAAAAAGFYFLAYFITTLGAFGVIAAGAGAAGEPDEIDDYRGLLWTRPGLATVLAAMLLSLAGIPLTAGFIAKFYLVAAGASTALWLLLITLIVTSVVGLFYYLRVVLALVAPAAEEITAGSTLLRPLAGTEAWVLSGLFVALLWVGVYPQPFLGLVLGLR